MTNKKHVAIFKRATEEYHRRVEHKTMISGAGITDDRDADRMWEVVHPGDEPIVNQCRDTSGMCVAGCYCSHMRQGYG